MQKSDWKQQLAWVETHTPRTRAALQCLSSSQEKLAVRFHIDLKMIPVIEGLARHLKLLVFPCHPDTTDPDGWKYLESLGTLQLCEDWSPERCHDFLSGDGFLCDLGGEMIAEALSEGWAPRAALEGTTTGIKLIAQTLERAPATFPIFDWNAAPLKLQVHNEKMVGYSLWQTFSEVTRLSLHGKRVGVFGFGPVGRGIARLARSLGAIVQVHDPSSQAGTLAEYEGFANRARHQLLQESEILVTATGRERILRLSDLDLLCPGAFLVNAGHSETEIDQGIREHQARETVLQHVEKIPVGTQNSVYLLARGRLLNLAAGFGDSINAFDLTTAQLVDAISHMLDRCTETPKGLHPIPASFFSSLK